MKALYCDCFSGISGDMFLAAVVDAGFPVEMLQLELSKLGIPAFEGISIEPVQKGPLRATTLKFRIGVSPSPMHRHLADIENIIQKSTLSTPVKAAAINIFTHLAEAEAKVHGTNVNAVHFHEVGGDDAILDIVGAAIVLDQLKIEQVYSSPLPFGTGRVNTQHGLLPVPAPATLELMRTKNCPTVPAIGEGELVTPTGAAILSCLATFSQPAFRVEKVGIGAGVKNFPWPNILRVVIGEMEDPANLVLYETNIDDMNPEIFGYLFERLFAANALDVFLTPIIMKKNRPATKVSVIAKASHETEIIDILMRETSTLGIRKFPFQRYEAARAKESVLTEWGEVAIKIKIIEGEEPIQISPEYEDCLKIARETGISLLEIYQQAAVIAHQKYLNTEDTNL